MRTTELYKKCLDCGLVLPLSDFWKDRAKRDGRSSYCKEDQKVRRTVWMTEMRKQDPARALEQSRKDEVRRKAKTQGEKNGKGKRVRPSSGA